MMKPIRTNNAPAPGGHYSQGTAHGDLIFVSGQLSIDPDSGEKLLGTIEEQTDRALHNVLGIVRAGGGDLDTILKVTVYVSDIEQWGAVNDVYTNFFGEQRPARAVIPCGPLHYGFLVEIDAVAHVKSA